jgi:serine/threonine-protein kinase
MIDATMITVPVTGGALPDNAAETIKLADLNAAIVVKKIASSQPAGTVAYTRPSAGQVIPRGSQVKIFVSSGGKTKIPSAGVVGETPETAITTLTALGFSAVAAPQPSQSQFFQRSPTIPAGRVVGTNPAVGSAATLTGAILLIISSGP